ncbi:MAG: aminotransferase class I/II-fold pyridoxal phosphate-dependent enzyme [Defluviitaleaceae bacterium]|nr:aminotransferase class I/II-fold pyridoxal phosphate-dependent enzyme [Defluviitaleaceae bacterium]
MNAQLHYNKIKGMNLSIDASRGKPDAQQTALSLGLLDAIGDCPPSIINYGGPDGIPEMKQLFADMLGLQPGEIIVGGNSSLTMMFDAVQTLVQSGLWQSGKTKIICPSPGYDRHFAICQHLDLEMITIPMTPAGPDMDIVTSLATDPNVGGIWCVPVFSNPQGYVYSAETVKALAALKTANPNFKILWDNAYAVHHFRGLRPQIPCILKECETHGHGARPIIFSSFSKISLPGAAVACMAGSPSGLEVFRKRLAIQAIGPDKVNQLRHVRFFKNLHGIEAHMQKHAAILRPKFELVAKMLAPLPVTFTDPNGGYFLSMETAPGKAKKIQTLCKEAGVLFTDAGATFPYGQDPADTNLRIPPTFLSMEELEQAMEVLCLAIEIA